MSKEIFKTVPAAKVPFSKFDLSHNRKLSCQIGQLVPVMCEETIPGDYWSINTSVFARLAPMIAPIMHKMEIFIHGFFVPCRVIWDKARMAGEDYQNNWEDFIAGETLSLASMPPNCDLGKTEIPVGGLADHMGYPVGTFPEGDHETVNVMPLLAYKMIWNDYYRDENLETEWPIDNTQTGYQWPDLMVAPLDLRAWEKDYFTSAWPFAQKGVASSALVYADIDGKFEFEKVTGGMPVDGDIKLDTGDLQASDGATIVLTTPLQLDIQELRRANKMQIWMETTARAGHRYNEFLKGHFGVCPKDERLQRPEYIGGGRFPFIISDVTNTSGFTSSGSTEEIQPLPMGTMAGKGVAYGNAANMSYKCTEHGYIIIIMSIRPEAVYYQGLLRKFSKLSYLDFPFPEFASLGEQEVLNKEIYYDGSDNGTVNNALFGYQSRYAEYKFIPNTLHGKFRTDLDMWHYARKFSATPDLNADFIHIDESNDDLTRIFAVENAEHVYAQVQHVIACTRPLPFFNIPSLE